MTSSGTYSVSIGDAKSLDCLRLHDRFALKPIGWLKTASVLGGQIGCWQAEDRGGSGQADLEMGSAEHVQRATTNGETRKRPRMVAMLGRTESRAGSSRRCGPRPPSQEYARLEENVEETLEKRPFCPRIAPQSYPVFLDGSFAATGVVISQHWTFWLTGKDSHLIAMQSARPDGGPLRAWHAGRPNA